VRDGGEGLQIQVGYIYMSVYSYLFDTFNSTKGETNNDITDINNTKAATNQKRVSRLSTPIKHVTDILTQLKNTYVNGFVCFIVCLFHTSH